MATNIEEGAVRARGEIDRALQTVSETADKKSLEDLLFKVRKFQKIFEGSGHGTSAAMLEKRALDIYAEKSGSEVFQRQLVLYRDARAAYELDDWVEAVRLLEKITDSLEDTPILPSAEELLTTIVRRQGDTSEVEEYVNVKFSTAREREEAGDLSRAVLALLEIVRRYPKSKWGKTATREIQRLKVQ